MSDPDLVESLWEIDVVDEVPPALREMHVWRAQAKVRYGLYIAHFRSHCLPRGWADRLHSKGRFGDGCPI